MRETNAANKLWDAVARAGLWRLYGNTLSLGMNRRYVAYARDCRSGAGGVRDLSPPFLESDPILVKRALDPAFAQQCSKRISDEIGSGRVRIGKIPFVYSIQRPLDLFGERFLEVFDGPLGDKVREVFDSEFRVQWLDCYRSVGGRATNSWLWHIDNHPPFVIKALIYLSPGTERNGVTRFLDAATTKALHSRGYFGVRNEERLEDLSVFPNGRGLEIREMTQECEPGDALLFSANLLHKGGPVLEGHRDVSSTLILPSREPWRQHYERCGRDRIQKAGGFPSDPRV